MTAIHLGGVGGQGPFGFGGHRAGGHGSVLVKQSEIYGMCSAGGGLAHLASRQEIFSPTSEGKIGHHLRLRASGSASPPFLALRGARDSRGRDDPYSQYPELSRHRERPRRDSQNSARQAHRRRYAREAGGQCAECQPCPGRCRGGLAPRAARSYRERGCGSLLQKGRSGGPGQPQGIRIGEKYPACITVNCMEIN